MSSESFKIVIEEKVFITIRIDRIFCNANHLIILFLFANHWFNFCPFHFFTSKPKFLDGHVKRIEEGWDETKDKAQARLTLLQNTKAAWEGYAEGLESIAVEFEKAEWATNVVKASAVEKKKLRSDMDPSELLSIKTFLAEQQQQQTQQTPDKDSPQKQVTSV